MAHVIEKHGELDYPCLACPYSYADDLFNEWQCDKKECVYDEETLQLIEELSDMADKGKLISIEDLIDRFIEMDIEYEQTPWTLKQILSQFSILKGIIIGEDI